MAQCIPDLPIGICPNDHPQDATCRDRYHRWDDTWWECELHATHPPSLHYEDRSHDGFTWWSTNTQRRDTHSWPLV